MAAEETLATNAAHNFPNEPTTDLEPAHWDAYGDSVKCVPKSAMLELGLRLEEPFDLERNRQAVRRYVDLITLWVMANHDGGLKHGNLITVCHVVRDLIRSHWKHLTGFEELIYARGMYLRAKGVKLPRPFARICD